MIDGLSSTQDVPPSVPTEVRYALRYAEKCVTPPDEVMNTMWGTSPSYVTQLRRQLGSDTLIAGVRILDAPLGNDCHRSTDLLSMLNALTDGRDGMPGMYQGVVLASETLDVDPELAALVPAGGLAEFYADQVAAGARQGLSAVGVMSSGWSFAVSRVRHEPVPDITIAEPGEQWHDPPEVIGILTELSEKLALHG
jgi:hypothetical protein